MKLLLFLTLSTVVFISAASGETAAEKVPCNTRSLLARENYKRPEKPHTDEQLQNIFENTRQLLINDISGGAELNSLHPYQQLMINRLRSVDFVLKQCASSRPGELAPMASYLMDKHRVEVCRNAKDAPEIALVSLFGHELGHSIDISKLSCKNYRETTKGINLPPFQSVQRTGKKSDSGSSIKMEDKPLDIEVHRINLQEIKSSHGRPFNSCMFRSHAERREITTLLNQGRIEVVDDGVPVLSHPQRAAFICMQQNNNWPAPPATEEEALIFGSTKYTERSAQMWGARAVARYVENKPNLTSQEALGVVALTRMSDRIDEKEKDINHLHLAEPALQRALRCEPQPNQNCMSHFQPHRGYPAAPSSTQKSDATL